MSKPISIAAALCALAGAAAPAVAQTSNSTLATDTVMSLISAADVTQMMNELGVETQLATTAESDGPFMVATTPGGGRFLFRFLGCEDPASVTGCRNTIVTAALPSGGKTYDDINTFNGNAVVTTAVNVPGQQMILFGRNIIVLGGHSRELFKGTIYLFLNDVEQFSTAQAATSVAFKSAGGEPSKISGIGVRTVADGPAEIFGIRDFGPDVAAAIDNTHDKDFKVDYDPGL